MPTKWKQTRNSRSGYSPNSGTSSHWSPAWITATISPEDKEQFQKGCLEADRCIQGAIDEITTFGAHVETASSKSPQKRGGVLQNFLGPVTIQNQVIATDNAIQNIGKVGRTGASLKEIADLINQSLASLEDKG